MLQQRLLVTIAVFLLGGLPAAQPSPEPAPTTPQAGADWTKHLHQCTPVSAADMLTLVRRARRPPFSVPSAHTIREDVSFTKAQLRCICLCQMGMV